MLESQSVQVQDCIQLVVRFKQFSQTCLIAHAAMSDTYASFKRFNSAASIAAFQLCPPRVFKIAIHLSTLSTSFNHHRSRHVPMTRQLTPTQGLSRSPIRAAFQKNPRNPVFSARSFGKLSFRYVHVQRKSKTTVRKDWKSKRADIVAVHEWVLKVRSFPQESFSWLRRDATMLPT